MITDKHNCKKLPQCHAFFLEQPKVSVYNIPVKFSQPNSAKQIALFYSTPRSTEMEVPAEVEKET